MKILQTCVVAAGFVLAATGPVSAADGKLLPVSAYAKSPQFLQAKISPEGKYLAVSMPFEGQTSLAILDIVGRKITGTLRFSHGEHVADFHWVGPERVIVSVANSFGPLDQPRPTGELYAMNADGSQKKYLFGYRGSEQVGSKIGTATKTYGSAVVVDPLPRDPRSALIAVQDWASSEDSAFPLVDKIDVYTGDRQRVSVIPAAGSDIGAVADRDGRLRFAVSKDRRQQVRLFATADGRAWTPVQHPAGAPLDARLHAGSADGSTAFLTVTTPQGRTCLQEYAIGGAFRDIECTDAGSLGEPVFSLDDVRPIGLGNGAGVPDTTWFDSNHPDAKLIASLTKAMGGQRIQVTSRTLDGKLAVVLVEGDRVPGDFFLFNRATKKADFVISRREWIDPKAATPVEPIAYKTRDGVTIPGYLTVRDGVKARNRPLVLMPHGGPHGPFDSWEWQPWPQLLASRGYAVLQVNFRGSGGYGPAHERAGYQKWGTLMQDDLTDAVRWAIAEGIADENRICIMGGSYGGYAALMSPTREPDLYRCAIGFAGVYDLEEWADDSDVQESMYGRAYLDRVLGDARKKAEQSPVTHVDKLKIPVLIAHGTADKRVPFSQAKILRKALDQHRKPYDWVEYKGEEHGLSKDENHADFLNKVLAFLDKHIGPGAPQVKASAP